MSFNENLISNHRCASDIARRKRLGQFFTGIGLSRVLAAIAEAQKAKSVIDPMAGNGDLLAACLELGAKPDMLGAIEIDPIAFTACHKRLPEASCVLGSAFDPDVLSRLPQKQWDLVIANPPYVRYQTMAQDKEQDCKLPGAIEVRKGLLTSLEKMSALDSEDKRLFRALTSAYSGLADLAVPSWILASAMVTLGGRLALVVPESWLSRDYASVVHYILLRWFQIEHIVEDEHAVWFNEAQVKTMLIVARRIKRKTSVFNWGNEFYVRTLISGKASGNKGPIYWLYPGEENPEFKLAEEARKALISGETISKNLCLILPSPILSMVQALQLTVNKKKWFCEVENNLSQIGSFIIAPLPLVNWMGNITAENLITLDTLDISIGQGLRTGANDFFYTNLVSDNGVDAVISFNEILGSSTISVPSNYLQPVIRKQAELPDGLVLCKNDLCGRVLDLRCVALPEDIASWGIFAEKVYTTMTNALANFIRNTKKMDFGKNGVFRSICELSAVAPNVRRGDPNKGIPPKFWYMLPDFAPRHRPDLIVPRINGGSSKAILILDKGIVADANFSTINVTAGSCPDAHAILALLNSAWCRAALEYIGAVMGGGALKVEATHLRRLPIPHLSQNQWQRLSQLGQLLINNKGMDEIDTLITSAVFGKPSRKEDIIALNALADEARIRRKNHKIKGT